MATMQPERVTGTFGMVDKGLWGAKGGPRGGRSHPAEADAAAAMQKISVRCQGMEPSPVSPWIATRPPSECPKSTILLMLTPARGSRWGLWLPSNSRLRCSWTVLSRLRAGSVKVLLSHPGS